MNNRKVVKSFVCILVCLAFLFTLIGCGAQPTKETEKVTTAAANETTKEEPKKAYKIGFLNYGDSNEFTSKVHQSIKAACEKAGVELLYAEALMDAQKVTSNADSLVAQGANLIFEFNWLPEVTASLMPMLKEKNVVMVTGDYRVDGAYYFGANNLVAGKKLGEYFAGAVEKKWQGQIDSIVMVYYQAGGEELNKRMKGIVDGLKTKYPDLPDSKIVWLDRGNGDASVVKSMVTDYLTAHPNDKHILIFGNNDETGLGALSAAETSNRQNDVLIGTHGADTPFQESIRAGKGDIWIGSVAYTPEKYGDFLIPWAIDILDGKEVPNDMNPEHVVITKDNIDQYYPVK